MASLTAFRPAWRTLVSFVLFALTADPAMAESAPTREYQVKAAFLLNFARFAEWPASSFATDDAPISIGILGDDPFGSDLEDTLRDETVRNRKLVIRHAPIVGGLAGCQIIFVSKSEQSHEANILTVLRQWSVLSVSDIDHFAADGGVIDFYLADNKVRFDINLSSAQQGQVKLSAQLLHLGRIVGPVPDNTAK